MPAVRGAGSGEVSICTKRDLSLLGNWADFGAFTHIAVPLITVGLITVGVSFLLRGDLTD